MPAQPASSTDQVAAGKKQTAALQALFATLFGGVISYNLPHRPEVPVLYVSAPDPVGGVYFELDPKHLAFFDSFTVFEDLIPSGRPFHEALGDVPEMLANMPKLTYSRPIYGDP